MRSHMSSVDCSFSKKTLLKVGGQDETALQDQMALTKAVLAYALPKCNIVLGVLKHASSNSSSS